MKSHQRMRGFTLLELMITVVIVSILAAIALPSYSDYVTRGRIPDATSELAARRVQMEQFYQDNHTYAAAPACTAATASQYFTFSCTGADPTTYTLKATGVGPMAGFNYTIDQSNLKMSALSGAPSGWSNPSTNNCWTTKKGGQC